MDLNLVHGPDETVISPYSTLVVAEGMDSDGNVVFAVMTSEGLDPVKALGMANYARIYTEEILKDTIDAARESQ
jgi:hypothetical protein